MSRPWRQKLSHHWRWLLPLLVLLAALLVVVALMLTREPPPARAATPRATLVETLSVRSASHQLNVEVQGTITPARQLAVQPQVAGRLTWVHPNLEPGGLIGAGETLFRIDDRDYVLAVEEAQTRVAEAEAQLRLERGRAEVAEEEWQLFKDEIEQNGNPALALREPQLASAQAQRAGAEAALQQARLDLARTEVQAPFAALVVEEQASVGQLVSTQGNVASLVATDHFWLQAAVARDRLGYIDIPRYTAATGADVIIHYQVGQRRLQRRGQVLHLLGSLSEEGRMARLLIQVNDPLGLARSDSADSAELPLLLGSFVDATITGPALDNLIELPRRALQAGDRAFVVNPDQTLGIRDLDIVWRRADSVLVRDGLSDGDQVIISPLAYAFEGMPLRHGEAGSSSSSSSNSNDGGGDG